MEYDVVLYLFAAIFLWIGPGYFVYENFPDKKKAGLLGIVLAMTPIINFLIFMINSKDDDLKQHHDIVKKLKENEKRYTQKIVEKLETIKTKEKLEELTSSMISYILDDLNLDIAIYAMSDSQDRKISETISNFVENVYSKNLHELINLDK